MRRQILWIGAAVFFSTLSSAVAQPPDPAAGKVFPGRIEIPEISGAALLPDGRLLVVSDDADDNGDAVFLLEDASNRLATGTVKKEEFKPVKLKGADGEPLEVDDLEDVAWDRQSHVFLVTSHSRNRRGNNPERRSVIVRLGLVGMTAEKLSDLHVPSGLVGAKERTPAQGGFNIEGAAWSQDGHLLLGLRSPTQTVDESRRPNEDGFVLVIRDPSAPHLDAEIKTSLNLRGSGIRGMFYDPEKHGLWILAGLSPDLQDDMVEAKWELFFLHDNGTLEPRALPTETEDWANAEAVTLVPMSEPKRPHLLLVEDGPEVSRYVLFPVSP